MTGLTDSNLNFERIQSTLGASIKTREGALDNTMKSPDFGSDIGSMLKFNMDMAYWSSTVNATAGIIKEIGDAMKSVVQKAA